jgi:hypothetical protein
MSPVSIPALLIVIAGTLVIIIGIIVYVCRNKLVFWRRNGRNEEDVEHNVGQTGGGETHALTPIRFDDEGVWLASGRRGAEGRKHGVGQQAGEDAEVGTSHATSLGPSEDMWFVSGNLTKNAERGGEIDAGDQRLDQLSEGVWFAGGKKTDRGSGIEAEDRRANGLIPLKLSQPGQEGMWLASGRKNRKTKVETDGEDGDMGMARLDETR